MKPRKRKRLVRSVSTKVSTKKLGRASGVGSKQRRTGVIGKSLNARSRVKPSGKLKVRKRPSTKTRSTIRSIGAKKPAAKSLPKGLKKSLSKRLSKKLPKRLPKSLPKKLPKSLPKSLPKRLPKLVKPVVLSKRERASRRVEDQVRVRIATLLSKSKRVPTHDAIARRLGISKALVYRVIGRPKAVRKVVKPSRGKAKRLVATGMPMSRKDEDDRAASVREQASKKLEKWKGGDRKLDSHISTGKSCRFTVRKRLTNALVARTMDRVHLITMRLDSETAFHEWMTVFSVLVVGKRHPKLPGYQPLMVKGLRKEEMAYVTYESTGKFRTEEDMRAHLASMLYSYVTTETYASLEQMSVSTLRGKSAEERVEWFGEHRHMRGKMRRARMKSGR